jgi:hypothetical protein
MNEGSKKFYGKYRGMVLNNIDPLKMGRVLVQVSDVSNVIPSSWAMPCVPVAGIQTGIYLIPLIGAGVWVEYEQGNPDYPIWVGCFWGSAAEVPATAALAPPGVPVIIAQTPSQNALVIADVPVPPMFVGGVMLKSGVSMLIVDPTGVTITAPKIQINGVTIINNGALTVTL